MEHMTTTGTDGRTVLVRNPANVRQVVGDYVPAGESEVDSSVLRAQKSLTEWSSISAAERYNRLQLGVGRVHQIEDLAGLLSRETGKTFEESAGEPGFLDFLMYMYADAPDWIDGARALEDDGSGTSWLRNKPFGVVAAITPYNYPLLLSALKVIPALLTGNAVVLAVAPTAPLGTTQAFRAMAEELPDGLLTVLNGPGKTVGQALVTHPRVRKVSFTGSTATGRAITAAAAENLKSVTLELGGNDPAVVLPDCELDDAFFDRMVAASFMAAGQVCFGIKRVYAPNDRVDEIAAGLGVRLDRYVIGDGMDPSTTMGPVHTAAQRGYVRELNDEARASGATVRTHGSFGGDPDLGWFLLPSIVTGASHAQRIVSEEQFGPSLPIVGYDSIDQAVEMANDNEYGLSSSVWSADPDHATSVAARIDAGATYINNHGLFAMDARPGLGGFRQSGNGAEGGQASLQTFTQQQVVTMKSPPPG